MRPFLELETERDWVNYIIETQKSKIGQGRGEARLWDRSRVDILTDELAIEVDWARKWPEALGQAIFYGIQSDRSPAVILLLESGMGAKNQIYAHRAKVACTVAGVALLLWDCDLREFANV